MTAERCVSLPLIFDTPSDCSKDGINASIASMNNGEHLEELEGGPDDVSLVPESADPIWLIESKIPADLREKYEVYSYRSAATILAESFPDEFEELCAMLRDFEITTTMIRTAGGNESDIPKLVSRHLRPRGWSETSIQGDLLVRMNAREYAGQTQKGKDRYETTERTIHRGKFLDGHKVDYVKGRVAFDLEWNSKDQTFDRDLYAFSAFAQCGVIDVGVLVTRSSNLSELIKQLGPALTKKGEIERTKAGNPRKTIAKYGASTTWMGKLLYRLNAGRNGACPVLVFGIGPNCVNDWPKPTN